MAEAAGLAIGVVSLVGLFTSCADAIKYIKLGQEFAQEFTTCALRLVNLELRLNRWGESMAQYSRAHHLNKEDLASIDKVMVQVKALIAEINVKSTRLHSKNSHDSALVVIERNSDSTVKRIAQSMGLALVKHRKEMNKLKEATMMRKGQWVIYEREQFRVTIGNISSLIDDLDNLYPGVKEVQVALARLDLKEVKDNKDVKLLMEAIKKEDAILTQLTSETEGYTISGSSRVHAGNSYGFADDVATRK
ncbi:kinesin light chain [Sclerotinia borealis F-4128]|uniref:Kinesin light chain n=1 Tax=Sclerotinia borealis (strain F-4128) TaxID=1432307 RepID=W9C1Q1_SCLBF|nr:kinesin light chain [Sclerotinia borealis F-4128]